MQTTRNLSATSFLVAFFLAVIPAVGAHAATWTFVPELKRLDADGNEMPAGQADITRDQGLRIGLYMTVSTDGVSPIDDSNIGFESLSGAIHFISDELGLTDIGPVIKTLKDGEGWERRMMNTSFRSSADRRLGPPQEAEMRTAGSFSGTTPQMWMMILAARGACRKVGHVRFFSAF